MTIKTHFNDHPEDYTGLPYLTTIVLNKKQYVTVVDHVANGRISYYQVDALDFDTASAFLTAVEEYFATKAKDWPLSVFLSANNLTPHFSDAWRSAELLYVKSVTGPAPSHWFNCVKAKWRRRDLQTGQLVSSKARRSKEEIEAQRIAVEEAKAAKKQARLDRIAAEEQRKRDNEAKRIAARDAKLKAREEKVASMQNEKIRKRAELRLELERKRAEREAARIDPNAHLTPEEIREMKRARREAANAAIPTWAERFAAKQAKHKGRK